MSRDRWLVCRRTKSRCIVFDGGLFAASGRSCRKVKSTNAYPRESKAPNRHGDRPRIGGDDDEERLQNEDNHDIITAEPPTFIEIVVPESVDVGKEVTALLKFENHGTVPSKRTHLLIDASSSDLPLAHAGTLTLEPIAAGEELLIPLVFVPRVSSARIATIGLQISLLDPETGEATPFAEVTMNLQVLKTGAPSKV